LWERFGGSAWQHAAGWEGIALAGLALYGALAVEFEAAVQKSVLPLGRHGAGRAAVYEWVGDGSRQLRREPGVRSQL
jgi:hypothetical protein